MDDKYYDLRISPYVSSEKPFFMCCNGKSKVIGIKRILNGNIDYAKVKALYFVDKDFDDLINEEDLFETDCYSIENYYVQKDCLADIIRRELYIYDYEENFGLIMDKYDELQKEFHKVIVELNAFILYQRKKENNSNEKRKLHLNQINYKDIYSIGINGIIKKYDTKYLRDKFPEAYEFTDSELSDEILYLQSQDASWFFRGKFEFHFLCSFLETVIDELNKCKKGITSYFKFKEGMKNISLNVSSKSELLLSPLSTYALTPSSLKVYIERMVKIFAEVS